MTTLVWRALLGLVVASSIALAAQRVRALTRGGAVTAALIGTVCFVAGGAWVALLLFFFITSSALTQWRADLKRALLASMVEKGGERDTVQVLANGAIFAVAALAETFAPGSGWQAVGAGAIATAAADTWGTEVGTVWGSTPRHILNGAPMASGASGGVTLIGSIATVLGAASTAGMVWGVHWSVSTAATISGGIAGAVVDSILGATVQERRWCGTCGRLTERRVHTCGAATDRKRGIAGFGNDAVNLTSIMAGALITRVLS